MSGDMQADKKLYKVEKDAHLLISSLHKQGAESFFETLLISRISSLKSCNHWTKEGL